MTSSPTFPPRSQARSRRLPSFARALPSARRRSRKTATSRRRLIGAAVLAGGCGLTAANSAVQQEAQAACLSASANITDLAAKKAADQACRAVGSGNAGQLAHAAIQAARQRASWPPNRALTPQRKRRRSRLPIGRGIDLRRAGLRKQLRATSQRGRTALQSRSPVQSTRVVRQGRQYRHDQCQFERPEELNATRIGCDRAAGKQGSHLI